MLEKIYFGTYTRNNSKGIYQAKLDTEKKEIRDLELFIDGIVSPTYLTTTDSGTLLTIAGNDQGQGGVASYNLTTPKPVLVDQKLADGASPCYVSYDGQRKLVYTANYHKGLVEVYRLENDNTLTLKDSVTYEGKGPRPEQDKSHAHYADLTPDNKLITIDLGDDKVLTYDVSEEGKISEIAAFQTPEGFGPRHIVFSNDGKLAYLAGELSSEVAVLEYNNGILKLIQIVSTIPVDWTKHNGVAAIRISSDDRFVYVSNRGHNSIAVFEVEEDGILKLIQTISTNGDFPRDFALDNSERFIVVAHQNSTIASLFARNETSGKLELLQTDIPVPEGVCVHFVK